MAANDVILGHMITYLNDKGDWQLHKCFFECIVDVVAYLGWPAVCLVEPLLLQVRVDYHTYLSVGVVDTSVYCHLLYVHLSSSHTHTRPHTHTHTHTHSHAHTHTHTHTQHTVTSISFTLFHTHSPLTCRASRTLKKQSSVRLWMPSLGCAL